MDATIRQARVGDITQVADMINDYAERGLMLHRSHAELYERLRDYLIAEIEGRVVGICGLRILWANLAEVYALAVDTEFNGQGIGRRLVAACGEEAERLGIRKLFALTYERRFFERCGFEVVDRHRTLPLKVWSECIRCPKNQMCDEIAMVRVLEHVPEVGPTPGSRQFEPGRYDVPVVVDQIRIIENEAVRTEKL
ncbi:MAG: N-acetyltransferase [Phycisphaera sp.]|nr:N-acetyltransferase [Phycisphaera sp.]